MDRFWEWVATKLGRDRAFSARVWVSQWGVLTATVPLFVVFGLILFPYAFEDSAFEEYLEGDVVSSTVIPGTDHSPPAVVFITNIDGRTIELTTDSQALAGSVGERVCAAKSRGAKTERVKYALMPMSFCR